MPQGVRRRIAVLAMAGTGALALLGGTAVAAGWDREPAPQVRITSSDQRGLTPVQQSQPERSQDPQDRDCPEKGRSGGGTGQELSETEAL